MSLTDISALWNTGDINSRVTNACQVIDNAGVPYIIAPVQHGIKCFNTEGELEWTYNTITNGYDVRDLAVGNLNGTGYNDCVAIASGYYTTATDGKVGIVDKDGNQLDLLLTSDFGTTGTAPSGCYGIAISGTDIYVSTNRGLHKFIKSGSTWTESWYKELGTCAQVAVADMGNGTRIYVACGTNTQGVYCYQSDGTLDWTSATGNQYTRTFAIGKSDSTKTGLQMAIPYQSGFSIVDKDGNLSQNYTAVGNNVRCSATFYDCDDDGEDEIYFSDMGEDAYCIERTDTDTYTVKYTLSNFMDAGESGIAHYDINEDGDDEIFLFTTTGHLYIYNKTLNTLIKDLNIGHGTAGGYYVGYQTIPHGINFVDIDGDGHDDIVISGTTGYADVFVTEWDAGVETYTQTVSMSALLRLTDSKTSALDALLRDSSTKDMVVDALLRYTDIKQADIDALLRGTATQTIDLSAIVGLENYEVYRRIGLEGEWEHIGDVEEVLTSWDDESEFTPDVTYYYKIKHYSDAYYSNIVSVTFTSGGVTYTRTIDLSSLISESDAETVLMDVLLKIGDTKTVNLGMNIRATDNKTTALDMLLRAIGLSQPSIDLLLRIGDTKTIALDILLKISDYQTVLLDMLLRASGTTEATIDILLRDSDIKTALLDILVKGMDAKEATIDALIKAVDSQTVQLSILLRDAGLSQADIDTLLRDSDTKTVLADLLLRGNDTQTISLSALLQLKGITQTVALDAIIKLLGSQSVSLDALIKGLGITTTAAIDAIIGGGQYKEVNLDLLLRATDSKTASIDLLIQALGITETAAIDLLLKDIDTQSVNLDTLLKSLGIAQNVALSALLKASSLNTVDIDTLVSALDTKTLSLDALIRGTSQSEVLLGSLLKSTDSQSIALDVLLTLIMNTWTASIDLDAILAQIGLSTLRLDMIIQGIDSTRGYIFKAGKRRATLNADNSARVKNGNKGSIVKQGNLSDNLEADRDNTYKFGG